MFMRIAAWGVLVLSAGLVPTARGDDWPQWLGSERDGIWRETGILDRFPPGGPKILWRTPLGGGYAGPAVAGGRVYVTDRQLNKGSANPKNPFSKEKVQGTERVLCLNEKDGKVIWSHSYPCDYQISYPAGPRTTPIVAQGRVYTLGAMGDLLCLDASSGKVIWARNFPQEFKVQPPMWGWSASPLLDGDRLICMVGGKGSVAVAFHKDTGKEVWRALSAAEPGYCPPMIFEAAGKRQLIIWHPESINSLNPESGESYWSVPFPGGGKAVRAGLTIPTPRKSGDLLFFTSFYNGPILLRLAKDQPAATEVWRGESENEQKTDKLHAIMCTPFIKDGFIYGVCSYGQLRCLRLDNGERVWETLAATGGRRERWANAFLVEQGGRFFLFNEQGDLIMARLSPKGYEELGRFHVLEPTTSAGSRDVNWSYPAFANRRIYARNDREIVCVDLSADR